MHKSDEVIRATPDLCGVVRGQRGNELVCQALLLYLRIEAYGIIVWYDDTIPNYKITTEQKLNKKKMTEAITFCKGLMAGLSAGGIV